VSPQVGELDQNAFDAALRAEPGATLQLLAELVTATDEQLRRRAYRLAGKILLELGRDGAARRTGIGRLHVTAADRGGDVDIDRSLDAVAAARAAGRAPALGDLFARDWRRPDLALCLLVDASGSMRGDRLATAALTAAACAWRAPAEFAVLSFAASVRTHRTLTAPTPAVDTVTGLLALRGHGVTALGAALDGAAEQLRAARASRRVTVLLSDCRATDEQDPIASARAQDELIVLAPADDCAHAAEFSRAAGARLITLASPADAPGALAAGLAR
jgi:Mg-chelatase subunit ChlD